MTSHKLGLINKNQWGFTMLELMLVLAITGLVSSGVTMTFFQVVNGSARANNYMTAVRQVQNAGYWVSYDTQLAQDVDDDPMGGGFPLVLSWTEWGGDEHEVTYSLEDMAGGLKQLKRSHLVNDDEPIETIVARCIEQGAEKEKTNADFIDTNGDTVDDTLILKVTVIIGSGLQEQDKTRVYRVVPRPGSE
jgi:prepilin-type N-terminal cleavage/methylation domain-containing protein